MYGLLVGLQNGRHGGDEAGGLGLEAAEERLVALSAAVRVGLDWSCCELDGLEARR